LFTALACGLLCCSTAAFSQSRAIGTRSLILDDGTGNTVTIKIPTPTTSYTWTLPPSSPPSNMPGGTLTNSTLRWNGSNWVENTSFLANAGALSASSLTLSTPLTVASGGTGVGTLASNGVLFGNGTGNVLATAAGTSGQLLLGV